MIGGNELEIKNKTAAKEEFFFAGGQEYMPQTVRAENLEEATKVYNETKIKKVNNK